MIPRQGPQSLLERLRSTEPLVLDGATGTELERRGVPAELPLWSARALLEAPGQVLEVHTDYAVAGADLLTANTFRTHRRNLATGGFGARALEISCAAVDLARRAAGAAAPDRSLLVLGSAAPLEDCYRPDLVPTDAELDREHALHAEHLAAAGVDGILIESMNTRREARAALLAAHATGLPSLLSFVCWDGATLLSGEPLRTALDDLREAPPAAVLVNCLPPSNVDACLGPLLDSGLPFGAYPNLGAPTAERGEGRTESLTPREFAERAARWRVAGAQILGGCCGTTPAHTRAIAQRLRN